MKTKILTDFQICISVPLTFKPSGSDCLFRLNALEQGMFIKCLNDQFKWTKNIMIRVNTLKLKNGISRLSNDVFTCKT